MAGAHAALYEHKDEYGKEIITQDTKNQHN